MSDCDITVVNSLDTINVDSVEEKITVVSVDDPIEVNALCEQLSLTVNSPILRVSSSQDSVHTVVS